MSLVARRRAAVIVPWLALAAVTAFAIVQMRARHEAAEEAPVVAEHAVPDPAAGSGVAISAEAVHAAETALDAALQDLEGARAETARVRREGARAAARAEAAEARVAVHTARAKALEMQIEALREAALEHPVEEPAEVPPPAAEPADELIDWVEDATSEDRKRRRRAAESAGDLTDDAVIAVLLETDTDLDRTTRVVYALGAEILLRPAVLETLLGRASYEVLDVALDLLAGHEERIGGRERRIRLAGMVARRLASGHPVELHAAARAAALLRLPDLAERLAALLTHDEDALRVVAAHALSLVPDLNVVRAEAVKALPKLLLDDSPSVRTAGALLAEALVGEPLNEFDPTAGEGARREALDAILDRLD